MDRRGRFPLWLLSLGFAAALCVLSFAASETIVGYWILAPGFYLVVDHLIGIRHLSPRMLSCVGILFDIVFYAVIFYGLFTIKRMVHRSGTEAE